MQQAEVGNWITARAGLECLEGFEVRERGVVVGRFRGTVEAQDGELYSRAFEALAEANALCAVLNRGGPGAERARREAGACSIPG